MAAPVEYYERHMMLLDVNQILTACEKRDMERAVRLADKLKQAPGDLGGQGDALAKLLADIAIMIDPKLGKAK